jgi:hypothetical protein
VLWPRCSSYAQPLFFGLVAQTDAVNLIANQSASLPAQHLHANQHAQHPALLYASQLVPQLVPQYADLHAQRLVHLYANQFAHQCQSANLAHQHAPFLAIHFAKCYHVANILIKVN